MSKGKYNFFFCHRQLLHPWQSHLRAETYAGIRGENSTKRKTRTATIKRFIERIKKASSSSSSSWIFLPSLAVSKYDSIATRTEKMRKDKHVEAELLALQTVKNPTHKCLIAERIASQISCSNTMKWSPVTSTSWLSKLILRWNDKIGILYPKNTNHH